MSLDRSAEFRFFAKVEAVDGCWLWTAALHERGYGMFWFENSMVRAHRWSWEFFRGEIPDGLIVDHICHNDDPMCKGGDTCAHRRCVYYEHLDLVPPRVNSGRSNNMGRPKRNQVT